MAQAAALEGRPELARELAAALLAQDPTDRVALIVLAVVEPRLGRPSQGRKAGQRAWRASQTDIQRYEAARLTALAALAEGNQTLAQLWLRRAATVAPTEAALAQTARDFAQVRAANPWNVQLSFDAAPSSNVNGGASTTEYVVEGQPYLGQLSDEALALSGATYSADLQLSYRLRADATRLTRVSARLYGRGVLLSDDARDTAPDAENGDFSAAYAGFTLSEIRAAEGGNWGIEASLGGNWYGGDLSYGFVGLGAHRTWRDGDRSTRVGLSHEHREDRDGPWGHATRLSARHGWDTDLGRVQSTAVLEWADAPNPTNTSTALRLSTGLALSEPLGPARIALSAGIEAKRFDEYFVAGLVEIDGGAVPTSDFITREDLRGWGTVSATFSDWSYGGFAPVLTVQASRSESNVSRFDRSELSLGLSFRSTF